jgi:hypothetical protein
MERLFRRWGYIDIYYGADEALLGYLNIPAVRTPMPSDHRM